jgi:hypothetical protein
LPTATYGPEAALGPGSHRPGGGRTVEPGAPQDGAYLGTAIDPVVGFAVALWSLTSACGVLLFAFAIRWLVPREREIVGPRPSRRLLRTAPASVPEIANIEGASRDQTAEGETALPLWLRPPPGAERPTSNRLPSYATREPQRFSAPAKKGVDRSTVAYRLVRLSDAPDDDRSVEIGRLDRGDEVEVIGDSEGYLKVRTPSGLEGWVPRMVLVG